MMICLSCFLATELVVCAFYGLGFVFTLLLRSIVQPKSSTKFSTPPQSPARNPKQQSPRKDLYNDTKAATAVELPYHAPNAVQRIMTACRVLFFPPWLRLQRGSVLEVKVTGLLPETFGDTPSSEPTLPALCAALHNAAYDPRITAVIIKPAGIKTMWARLQELRRHIDLVRSSGKVVWAYVERGGMKEYYLASACKRIFVPPSAQLSLTGFTTGATSFRGVLAKVGVQPEVVRCGKYKSAADQFMGEGMTDANREQLTALMQDTQDVWLQAVAASRGKSIPEVSDLLDEAHHDMEALRKGGWLDGLLYENQMKDRLKRLLGSKAPQLATVSVSQYSRQSSFVPTMRGGPTVAVIRAEGMILGSGGMLGMKTLNVGSLISQVRAAKQNRTVKAVVVRVDSPGGDALASDLMWREVHELALTKPVIASMGNVAGSGGYMLAMAANAIVAEPLTIAGSIGVVSGKFCLEGLYEKTGYKKEVLSVGKFADMLADNRGFNEEEKVKFKQAADHTYEAFRNKAALSRNMAVEDMERVAQGRIWSGTQAVTVGLADALGGMNRALMLAKEAAGIPAHRSITVKELSMSGWANAMQMLSSFTASVANHAVGSVFQGLTSNVPGAKALTHEAALLANMASSGSTCFAMMDNTGITELMAA